MVNNVIIAFFLAIISNFLGNDTCEYILESVTRITLSDVICIHIKFVYKIMLLWLCRCEYVTENISFS